MTDLSDGILALIFAAVLNAVVVAAIALVWQSSEKRFVIRVYVWTLMLRCLLALALNLWADT